MTEKDYHYVFIFLTIYFGEFLHFSEKKFNDIFRKNDNETNTYYPLLNTFLQIKTMAIQVSDSTMTYLPADAHVMR